ncbi:Gfo/Idh/MocA family oxidoreductase [Inquilinus sp. CAU 1745]|uniref:Gfo/Idh/MocA family protein n=1 Tax=Inquilinus sp. CAU 1745 TaxID=3140369 RepID=UPI00325C3232
MATLSWGILSTANIGLAKVIPAMQKGKHCRIDAIASRDIATARKAADRLGVVRAYGSYEELLADPDIDAIYNPLPNHLHVPWTVKAAEAGKHVLCEKPIAMTAEEAETLIAVRDRTGVRIQEAFMVRTHPQWLKVRDLVAGGAVGELRAIQGFFSYFNDDPANIRNMADIGGGGMLDIGCYPVTTARFVTGAEPTRVTAMIDRDPSTGIDRLGSALMDFPGVQASFVYSTQALPHQRMRFVGTSGMVEVEIPFNAPPDRPCRVTVDRVGSVFGEEVETIELSTVDQYTVAGDAFSRAILEDTPQPVPLEDSILNMRVLDALFRSAESGVWEKP